MTPQPERMVIGDFKAENEVAREAIDFSKIGKDFAVKATDAIIGTDP